MQKTSHFVVLLETIKFEMEIVSITKEKTDLQQKYDLLETEKNEAVVEKEKLLKQLQEARASKQRLEDTKIRTRSSTITEENKVLRQKLIEAEIVILTMKIQIEELKEKLAHSVAYQKVVPEDDSIQSESQSSHDNSSDSVEDQDDVSSSATISRKRELDHLPGEYVEEVESKKIKSELLC